jgi:hypothetical protein
MTVKTTGTRGKRVWSNWLLVPLAVALIGLLVVALYPCMYLYLFVSLFPWPSLLSGTQLPAIHDAALQGDVEGIRFELDAGVDVDLRTLRMEPWVDGATPLMFACYGGHTDAVRYLIESGADVMATDARGGTPLDWALSGTWNGIQLLIEAGADVAARDQRGWTALMTAAVYGGPSQVAALIDAGADVHTVDSQGRTALDLARQLAPIRRDNIELLETAMREEADP